MTSPEFLSARDYHERVEDSLLNLERLEDVIRGDRDDITDGALSMIKELRSIRFDDSEDFDRETKHHIETAIAVQADKLVAFTTQVTDDMNNFIQQHPKPFYISEHGTADPEALHSLMVVGEGEDTHIAARTATRDVLLLEGKHTLLTPRD